MIAMNKYVIGVLLALLPAVASMAQPPYADLQKKVYPDPAGVVFTTPTLSLDEDRFASYDEVMAWLSARAEDPRMDLSLIGTTTKGRAVPMYRLSNGKKGRKVKVWLQGAIHGNEPATAEALFQLTDDILGTKD